MLWKDTLAIIGIASLIILGAILLSIVVYTIVVKYKVNKMMLKYLSSLEKEHSVLGKVKPCTNCGLNMVSAEGTTTNLSNPPQYNWFWWCACGRIEHGGTYTKECYDPKKEDWIKANANNIEKVNQMLAT